jgi:PilZ domain-containing protein
MKKFLTFFKRIFSKNQESSPPPKTYQRDFDRFPIEFEVRVSFVDNHNEEINDRAALRDVSGSGAMFITRIPEKYYLGQILTLTIFLAGTDEVSACMRGEASVARIHQFKKDDGNIDNATKGIGVKFNEPFDFKRIGC